METTSLDFFRNIPYCRNEMTDLETFNERRNNEKRIRTEENEEIQNFAHKYGSFELED